MELSEDDALYLNSCKSNKVEASAIDQLLTPVEPFFSVVLNLPDGQCMFGVLTHFSEPTKSQSMPKSGDGASYKFMSEIHSTYSEHSDVEVTEDSGDSA